MPAKGYRSEPLTPLQVATHRIDVLEARLTKLSKVNPLILPVIDIDMYNDPLEGELVLDWRTYGLWFFHEEEWWPVGNMVGLPYSAEVSSSTLTATLKSAPGILIGFELYNEHSSLPYYVYIYDNTAASGTVIERIRVPARGGANVAQINKKFTTGLTIKVGGAVGATGNTPGVAEINLTYR